MVLNRLQMIIGFPVKRKKVLISDDKPYDESISYNLCLNYYGKMSEIEETIINIQKLRPTDDEESYYIYTLLGNLFYLKGDYANAAGNFMIALSINRQDLASWYELLFSLRALGEFELFDTGMFNLHKVIDLWSKDSAKTLSQNKVKEILNCII